MLAKISQCLPDFRQADLMLPADGIEHMDLDHVHEGEERTPRLRQCDERCKGSCTRAGGVRTPHDPRPQCGLRNLQIVRYLGYAIGRKFAHIFVCVEVGTSLTHVTMTIECSYRTGPLSSLECQAIVHHVHGITPKNCSGTHRPIPQDSMCRLPSSTQLVIVWLSHAQRSMSTRHPTPTTGLGLRCDKQQRDQPRVSAAERTIARANHSPPGKRWARR